jgi:hypothetical protein
METIKIKIEFDGWHCLSKKQCFDILQEARKVFVNANFSNNYGLLIETEKDDIVFPFCLTILDVYKDIFKNWDGYTISRLSKKIILNFADRKRKLKFDYFKQLIKNNVLDEIKIILAGNLYIYPDEAIDILTSVQQTLNNTFRQMTDEELLKAYNLVLMKASERERKL